ncbi:unnamed protein product [Sphenostylis stenocarpa]|uniref:eIF3a PCI domain-containing protein n=1 Tax=Sphenostylis stenocarpa TaxID=92480 RepID=A0AA86S2S0_9FABA|nr:unnamed protein product [Sphenostylis stenocarpa]
MFKYVVDMQKGRFAKDGLIQYRIICQQVNVSSLEEVIKHFVHLSTEKAEQALHRAFQFCKQYKRTTEFCRLCEIIRNHLANLNKYCDQHDRPDLSAPERLQFYLDTRVEQLKIATELELWQEAFRSVEDIHGLMCLVKKTPKPSLMVVYYVKLTEIFWISSSHLYHAYAWFRLFLLQKSFNKNLSQKDLQLIASSVILTALLVPPHDRTYGASHLELEPKKERNLRMDNLIGFNLETKPESKEKTPLNLVSAMKGSREKHGGPHAKLHVKWAHDVYDPIPTLLSHTVKSNKKQRKSRKKKPEKKNGKKGKKGNSSQGDNNKDQQFRKLGGISGLCYKSMDSCDPVLVASSELDALDVLNQDWYCGTSFLKKSVTEVHYSVAEAL